MDYENRLKEFIWYHINGDGDCNGQVLRAYAEENGLNEQDCFDLAYFYSVTYCCASAVFLLENREFIKKDRRGFVEKYKNELIFQSDRKYVRYSDRFNRLLQFYCNHICYGAKMFRNAFVKNRVINTSKALLAVNKWYYFSRYSAFLFVETYCDIFQIDAVRIDEMNYGGDRITFVGGLFYVFGLDEEARYVKQHHRIPIDNDTVEVLIRNLQDAVKTAGGDDNITKLETSLCAYDKFFIGSRYNGYYADRMLEELVVLKDKEDFVRAVQSIYAAREKAIPSKYRGEAHDWNGIRTWLKKYYKINGKINGYGM